MKRARHIIANILLFNAILCMGPGYCPLIAQVNSSHDPAGDLTQLRSLKMLEISDRLIGDPDSLWFMGIRYPRAHISAVGTPYFYDQSAVNGNIRFNQWEQRNETFLYDIERDELVLLADWGNGTEHITLTRGWVEWADLKHKGYNHRFITENHHLIRSYGLQGGYYEIVHSGAQYLLLAKHQKGLEFRADQSDHNVYVYSRQLLLIGHGQLHDVSSERRFLGYFSVYKKELRKLRKAQGVKFQEATSEQLRLWMEWCEAKDVANGHLKSAP
jgi:hypothetical protein